MIKKYLLAISFIIFSCFLYGCDYFGPGMADFNYHLAGKYQLFKAGDATIWANDGHTRIVEGNVTGIAWDEDFILAEQTKDSNTNYWIIDVKNDKVYSPTSEKDFNEKRKELKVNSKLKLKKPETFKHLDTSPMNK